MITKYISTTYFSRLYKRFLIIIVIIITVQSDLFCQKNGTDEFTEVLYKAIKAFPSDSLSLMSYSKAVVDSDSNKKQAYIEIINSFLSENFKQLYHDVENNLKPLLKEIVSNNTINTFQLVNLVTLYCDYDYYRGRALFSQLFSNDENYNLVWKSFHIISNESKNDTTYISALIKLSNKIRTNVELAEALPFFVIESVQNNPEGFMDMCLARKEDVRDEFTNRIMGYASNELIAVFADISENSTNNNYKKVSKDIIKNVKPR